MENNIEMIEKIENMLNTERRNRRGNREIRFEVNSNYYKAVSKLLSDYKRALKENERLQKENEMFSFSERVIKEVVKRDDEYTKQVIRDYFTKRYPKENLKFDFLDEEIVNEIIKLGIAEYKKRQALGGVLSERKYLR